MLSWFAAKPGDEKNPDPFQSVSRTAFDAPSSPEKPDGPSHSLVDGISTPHDEVLAGIYAPGGSESGDISHARNKEHLYDPFDGSLLGDLVTPDASNHPGEDTPLSEPARKNEELWTHLSRVLELQSQIARMHVDMEGVGGNKPNDKGKVKGKASIPQTTKRSWPEPPVTSSEGVEEDEGVDVKAEPDEEEGRNRQREEEFARLADQFDGRKQSINEIMSKLDELSKALTEFHTLQAPNIEFPPSSSRQNSATHVPPLLKHPVIS